MGSGNLICPNQTIFPHQNGHRVKVDHYTGAIRCEECDLEAVPRDDIIEKGVS